MYKLIIQQSTKSGKDHFNLFVGLSKSIQVVLWMKYVATQVKDVHSNDMQSINFCLWIPPLNFLNELAIFRWMNRNTSKNFWNWVNLFMKKIRFFNHLSILFSCTVILIKILLNRLIYLIIQFRIYIFNSLKLILSTESTMALAHGIWWFAAAAPHCIGLVLMLKCR